jgi:CubicO group peptidase (beta-lactamase class C family)
LLTSLFAALVFLSDSGGADGGLPSKEPSEVGMSAVRLQRVDKVLGRAIKAGGFPGGAVVIGRRGATVLEKGFGNLS